MKMFLIAAVFCFVNNAIAEVVTQAKKVEIVTAMVKALSFKDLDCTNTISGNTHKASQTDFGTIKSDNDFQLTVNRGQQPVIIISSSSEQSRVQWGISTNAEYTSVKSMDLKAYKRVALNTNVGTILDPVYETVFVEELIYNVLCN